MNAEHLPEASFLNFLSGLASQAMMQFGEIPNPHSGRREANLPFAAYTVQLLHILKVKTAGNLDAEEANYLDGVLSDLDARLERAQGG